MLIVDFHEFQETEARNEDSFAKIYIYRERSCTEADMVVAYHVGGRLGYGLWSSALVEMILPWPRFVAHNLKRKRRNPEE